MKYILLTLTICSFLFLTGCPFGKTDPTDFKGTPSQKVQAATAKGVSVRSGTAIPATTLEAIDRGLDKAFSIAESAPNNYSGFRRHATYTVWLWPRSTAKLTNGKPKCEQPSIYRFFNTNTSGFDGTQYDKDPRPGKVGLCFAGISKPQGFGGTPDVRPQMIIVDDAATIETVTWYEAEHSLLFELDVNRYAATIGNDHVHPILGEGRVPCDCVTEPCPCSGPSFAYFAIESPITFEYEGFSVTKGDILHGLLVK